MSDPLFWPDVLPYAVFLILAIPVCGLLYRVTVGRLPERQPGDVPGLVHDLAVIGCVGAIIMALLCSTGFYVVLELARLRAHTGSG